MIRISRNTDLTSIHDLMFDVKIVIGEFYNLKLRHPHCVRIQYDGRASRVKTQLIRWWSSIIK